MMSWLTQRRAWTLAVILVLGSWLSIVVAVVDRHLWDDWWLDAAMRGQPTMGAVTRWDLFRFATGSLEGARVAEGPAPWFTHPELRLALFRPLAVLSHVIDHHTVGFASWGSLVQNLCWLGLLIAAAGRLYFKCLSLPIAGAALVLLALEPSHNEPLGWTSARNALMAAALGFWALTLHVEADTERRRGKYWAAIALFALALLAGEVALGAFLFLGSYQLLGAAGSLRARSLRFAPYVGLVVLWLAAYLALGYGTRNSGFYVNPLHEPLAYLQELPAKFTALSSGALLGVPTSIWFFRGDLRLVISSIGCASLVLGAVGGRLTWPRLAPEEQKAIAWLSLGTALSLLPQCAGILSDRSLVGPTVGIVPLLSAVLVVAARELRGWKLWGARVLQGTFVLTHILLPLFGLWVGYNIYSTACAAEDAAFAASDLHELAGRRAIVLAAPDPIFALYVPSRLGVEGGDLPVGYHALSFAEVDHRLVRTAAREFELEQLERPRPGFEQAFRSDRAPLSAGERVDLGFMQASVLDVDGPWRKRVRFAFRDDLENRKLCFLMWKEGALREVELPPIGGSLDLPWTKGPWSLF